MPKEHSINLMKYSKAFYNFFPVLREVRLMTLHAKFKMYFQQQYNLCELHTHFPLGSNLPFLCKNHQLRYGLFKAISFQYDMLCIVSSSDFNLLRCGFQQSRLTCFKIIGRKQLFGCLTQTRLKQKNELSYFGHTSSHLFGSVLVTHIQHTYVTTQLSTCNFRKFPSCH